MKRTVKFVDNAGAFCTVTCEIKENRFSMSGETAGSMGQVQDTIEPKEGAQTELIELWKKWHLNDMKAGTDLQQRIIEESAEDIKILMEHENISHYDASCRVLGVTKKDGSKMTIIEHGVWKKELEVLKSALDKYDFDYSKWNPKNKKTLDFIKFLLKKERIVVDEAYAGFKHYQRLSHKLRVESALAYNKYLLKVCLYDLHPETGKIYKYGSGWLKRNLPEDIENQVNSCFDNVETEEKNRVGSLESIGWADIEDEKIIALAQHLEISPTEAVDGIEDNGDCQYSYYQTSYLVCEDDEADKKATEYLTDEPYLWRECVSAEKTELGLEEWAEWVIRTDGRGHVLNSYDGHEHIETVEGTEYFIYRN